MLKSIKDERARHFQLALRVGIPVMVLILTIAYSVFFHEENIKLTTQSIVLMAGLIFVVVYFIYFALEESRKESLIDPVTGGYRFNHFLKLIEKHHPKTLAAIRVDNLSIINENFGIKATDELLQKLIEYLDSYISKQTGKKGAIGRKYGMEFLIAIDTEPELIKYTLQEFIKEFSSIDNIDLEYKYTVVRNDEIDPNRAIEQLQNLLNIPDKCIMGEESDEEIESKKSIIPNIKGLSHEESIVIDALKKEQIKLQFRPLKNLSLNRIDMYEISVKLSDNDGKYILPRNFLPIINRHNLGEQYDKLLYQKIITLQKIIDKDISLSFNLSPFSLRKPEFHQQMIKDILDSGVAPERFIIELYEKKTHHRLDSYLDILKEIRKYGVRFCLDNFGSSNASMEYIKHFQFDMIQFDRDYISKLDDKKNFSIFQSLITMAHELNIATIAKWVDDKKRIEELQTIGIDYIQGYAVGRPLSEDEIIKEYNPISKDI